MWGFMRLECINGIEYNGQTILENEFAKYGILSTREAISDYFKKYGYRYVGVYDLAHDLIIVEDKNLEVEMILGQFYKSYLHQTLIFHLLLPHYNRFLITYIHRFVYIDNQMYDDISKQPHPTLSMLH